VDQTSLGEEGTFALKCSINGITVRTVMHLIEPLAGRPRAIRLGADKAYDAEDFVNEPRATRVTPHVAQNTNGCASAIDARTTRHAG
jgi:hypothetical protein